MRYRQLDANGDMTFGSGLQNFLINTPEAVAQAVETSLRLIIEEWYLDLTAGTDYFGGVLGVHSKETADQTLIARVNTVQGVTGLENWESTYDPKTRLYSSIGAKLFTLYGQTQLQINNLRNS